MNKQRIAELIRALYVALSQEKNVAFLDVGYSAPNKNALVTVRYKDERKYEEVLVEVHNASK